MMINNIIQANFFHFITSQKKFDADQIRFLELKS